MSRLRRRAQPPPICSRRCASLRGRWQQEIARARRRPRTRRARSTNAFAAAFDARVTRALAGGVRRHRSRSRREPQAHGIARQTDRGSRPDRSRARRARGGDDALSPTTRLRRDAQGSARRQHHRRQGRRGQPLAAPPRKMSVRHRPSWSRIGPVPEETRRPLADRFQRAIRFGSARRRVGQCRVEWVEWVVGWSVEWVWQAGRVELG